MSCVPFDPIRRLIPRCSQRSASSSSRRGEQGYVETALEACLSAKEKLQDIRETLLRGRHSLDGRGHSRTEKPSARLLTLRNTNQPGCEYKEISWLSLQTLRTWPGVPVPSLLRAWQIFSNGTLDAVAQEWLVRVDKEPELAAVPLSFEDRTGHLPQLLRDVIVRLRLDDDTKGRGFDDGGSSRRFTRQTGLHGGNGGGGISVASG